jgi:crossover junction endodeoxyribonuclease RuvC
MPILILGIDPGFANVGWALVELDGGTHKETLMGMGLIETEKSSKKQKVLTSDDNYRRAREIARAVRQLKPRAQVLCAESMSFPRNASAAAKVAMTWGVLADFCEVEDVPLLMASPKELKRAVCADASASKEQIQKALRVRFGTRPEELLKESGIPPSSQEHPYDALAAVVACLDSEVLRLLRKAS